MLIKELSKLIRKYSFNQGTSLYRVIVQPPTNPQIFDSDRQTERIENFVKGPLFKSFKDDVITKLSKFDELIIDKIVRDIARDAKTNSALKEVYKQRYRYAREIAESMKDLDINYLVTYTDFLDLIKQGKVTLNLFYQLEQDLIEDHLIYYYYEDIMSLGPEMSNNLYRFRRGSETYNKRQAYNLKLRGKKL